MGRARKTASPVCYGSIGLIATDLDGTLLDGSGRVPGRVRRAVAAATRTGVAVAYLTGRPLAGSTALLAESGLRGHLAASNGAIVQDPRGHVLLRRSLDDCVRLLSRLRAALPGVRLGVVTDRRLALDASFPADLADLWRTELDGHTVERLAGGGEALKVIAAHEGRTMPGLAAVVAPLLGDAYHVAWSTDRFLEISSASANKGDALARIASSAGVPLGAVAAVGDMPNDLPMLARAGCPVAVANADASVLAAVRLVVGSNREGGVAELLEAVVRAREGGERCALPSCGCAAVT